MMQLPAPAKINLFLHITGRREDGYHSLQSLIFFADIGDRIAVEVADRNQLIATGPYAAQLPAPEENLVMRALAALQREYPDIPPLQIHLEKRLPVASGIGGGSSDAAAVLRAAVALSQREYTPLALQPLLLSLGAEMPVCYAAEPALVQGIGEQVTPWPVLPEWGVVLINPNLLLPTKEVFAAMQASAYCSAQEFHAPRTAGEWKTLALETHNNMTAAAASLLPGIEEILQVLAAEPECFLARMSGSGATCFGLFENRAMAVQAAQRLSTGHPEWWVEAGGMYHGT